MRWLSLASCMFPTVVVSLATNRHICLFDSYSHVKGPHFNGLFDQLVEQTASYHKRLAFVTDASSLDSYQHLDDLLEDLGLDTLDIIFLDQEKPSTLKKRLNTIRPTIYWVYGTSSLTLRYYMRTSGMDGTIERFCDRDSSVLYVGEGPGSVCAGSHMQLASPDDAAAPEPQYRGLELLGTDTSVCFGDHDKLKDLEGSIKVFNENQVYVWSQSDGSATEFTMNPLEKGSIGNYSNRAPLPPLQEEATEGRSCVGEPAVDPSRMLRMNGDSEWFEGEV